MSFLVIVLAVISVSCSQQQKPVQKKNGKITIAVANDTSVKVPFFKTAPRYSCDHKKLDQPKLTGTGEYYKDIHFSNLVVIDVDSLLNRPVYSGGIPQPQQPTYVPNTSVNHRNFFTDSNWNWLWLVLTAIVLAVLFYLLFRAIWRYLPRDWAPVSKSMGSSKVVHEKYVDTTGLYSKEETIGTSSKTISKIDKEDYDGIAVLMDKAQKGNNGGVLKVVLDNRLEVTYHTTTPGIYIDASNNGTIGNITITDANVSNTYPGRHFHSGTKENSKDQQHDQ